MEQEGRATQRLWQVIRTRIERQFDTITESLEIGNRPLRFTRVADPNRVLDEMAEAEDRLEHLTGRRREGDDLHLPYWAEIWDSARAVAQALVRQAESQAVSGQRVLDLGCGMGLTGTVAAMLGASVTFADLEPAGLLFARLNTLPWRQRVRTRQLNWRDDRLSERFDLIIGADILYERAQWPALEKFWREHLADGGQVLLGEPGRSTGDSFIDWIQRRRWRLVLWNEPVQTRSTPVRLFWLSGPR